MPACQSEGAAQTQAGADRPFTVTEVAEFSTPWAMAFLPGSGVPLTNMALLTEKEGKLWLVDVTNGKRTAVSGVPRVVVAGQGGLGDVMPHPDFAGKPPCLPELCRGGARAAPAARRWAMGRSTSRNAAAAGAARFQGDLAAAAQGDAVTAISPIASPSARTASSI